MATQSMRWLGLVAMILLATGCSSTMVTFRGPPGAVMSVDGKPHHLPAQIEMSRPNGSSGANRHDVSLVFNAQQQPSQEVRATGYIDVYGYSESDIDRMAVNTCNLDESELVKILDGAIVVFKGQSASRQPLYDLTLRKQ